MARHIFIGKLGEDIACEFLAKAGYRTLERNYRKPWGEIDIVCRARDGTLIFVEVKALRRDSGQALLAGGEVTLRPEDNLSAAKLRKLRRTCAMYIQRNPAHMRREKGWRIDLVAIELEGGGEPAIRHYENI